MGSENFPFPLDEEVTTAVGEWASDFSGIFGPLMTHVLEVVESRESTATGQ